MNEHQMETRRRSRSKTPFLRSSCDHENCEHAGEEGHTTHQHKKKPAAAAPNVQTIIEETVEVTSSSSPTVRKSAQLKIKTSDYSSEDTSPENNIKSRASIETSQQRQQKSAMTASTTTTSSSSSKSTTIITKSKKMSSSSGNSTLAAATSTPKANYAVESFLSQFASSGGKNNTTSGRRLKEIAQNEINSEFERSQQQQQQQQAVNSSYNNSYSNGNRSFSRIFGNSLFGSATAASNNSGDVSDHIAYNEYRRAGEYWKKTPKTDYTYSELSPHRRVLAPGIVAMPNMSRRSLENHHERIHYMIERDPAQEEFIRRRYESSKFSQNRRETEKLAYESGDEVDHYNEYHNKHYYNTAEQQESWFMRIITTVVTTMTSFWSAVTGSGDYVDESAMYRTKLAHEQRGFFGSIADGVASAFVSVFRYIYLFISSVLSLDTWLLQSSSADNKSKKRFLLFLLILLPLLLLAGVYYYLHPNEPFPPTAFSQHIQTFTLPKIDMSEYVNREQYETLKSNAFNRLADFRDWTDDYVLYLRRVSQNIVDEGRKFFRREEYIERA